MSNRVNHLLKPALLLVLLAAWPTALTSAQQAAEATVTPAQETRPVISYTFVSPNTRENLTLPEAIAALNSADEQRLLDQQRQVACRLHLAPHVNKALGTWTDGAENSTLLRLCTNRATLRYAAAWLGKFARQKSVLYFRQAPSGRSRMYVFLLPRSAEITALATELDADGVANRTLVPRRKGMLIYIVDLTNELQAKVRTAARHLHARLSAIRGDGEFIGDDNDREKAQAVFEQEIRKYELAHPRVKRACRKKLSVSFMRKVQYCQA